MLSHKSLDLPLAEFFPALVFNFSEPVRQHYEYVAWIEYGSR